MYPLYIFVSFLTIYTYIIIIYQDSTSENSETSQTKQQMQKQNNMIYLIRRTLSNSFLTERNQIQIQDTLLNYIPFNLGSMGTPKSMSYPVCVGKYQVRTKIHL
jgi:hypothetical protein